MNIVRLESKSFEEPSLAGQKPAIRLSRPVALLLFLLLTTPAHARQVSWYSIQSLKDEGTWNRTKGVMSNGSKFTDWGLTCATRLFPLGCYLRITSIKSGKSVVVLVTDRISKKYAHRIDLSQYAFSRIADLEQGIVHCRINIIDKSTALKTHCLD